MSSTKNARGSSELRYTLEKSARAKSLYKRYGRYIRVNRQEYELLFVTALEVDGESCAGCCIPDDKQIYIDTTVTPIEETLIHELGHAEVHEAGYKQRTDWCPNMEELICELFGRSLAHTYTLKKR